MSINIERTVGDLAAALPGATRVFEQIGIDYCCGGGKSLSEACAKAGVAVETVTEALERAGERYRDEPPADWRSRSLADLAAYIVEKHHGYTKTETARLEQLSAKVAAVHGKNHTELQQVQELVLELSGDLNSHLMKEEQVLFPRIRQLDEALRRGESVGAQFLNAVRMPVEVMMREHDAAGEILRELRSITADYAIPADACNSYKSLYQALQELEQDLHQHIHLENNILFPRAVEMAGGAA